MKVVARRRGRIPTPTGNVTSDPGTPRSRLCAEGFFRLRRPLGLSNVAMKRVRERRDRYIERVVRAQYADLPTKACIASARRIEFVVPKS
jgi:hypothetical protein